MELRDCNYMALALILFIFGAFLLYFPPVAGLADNTDFIRICQPTGMVIDNNLKFFYFQRKFEYTRSFGNLGDFFRFVANPGIKNEVNLKTTQYLFVKTAQLASGLVLYLKNKTISHFDIIVLSIIFLILHSISTALLYKNLRTGKKAYDLVILLLIMLIYYNIGYLLYYNSFFGESAILSGFLSWFSVLLEMVQNGKKSYVLMILYFMAGIVFTGAKVANIPLGFLIGAFSIYFFHDVKTCGKKIIAAIGICLVFSASFYFYRAIPDWMKKPNNYHSIFFGILKNSDNPENDLNKLGIDTKYSVLANTNVYGDLEGFDIFSDEFQKEIYDKAGPLEVSLYYLKNPERMLEKLNISAEASIFIRPPYLGNMMVDDDTEILKFASRNTVWEIVRKQFTGYAFIMVTLVFLLYTSILIRQFILLKKQKYKLPGKYIPVKTLLMIFTASQWIFPVIGNGEADLIKHMFLFNLLFDTMIILLAADIMKLATQDLINRRIILTFLGSIIILVTFILAEMEFIKNDLVVFGKYKGQPIEWEVLDETDTHCFIIAKDIIDYRPFSSDGNYWLESDIRKWLNDDSESGFLFEFSDEEKNRIDSVKRKTLLAPVFKDFKESGSQPHHWFCIPGYVTQNYDDAYQVEHPEKVFILSVSEWESHEFKKRKGAKYWLRTPYSMDSTVRVVGEDGYVYHKKTDMKNIGVLPAMLIKK